MKKLRNSMAELKKKMLLIKKRELHFEIVIRSANCIFDLQIEFSLFDTFYSNYKIR